MRVHKNVRPTQWVRATVLISIIFTLLVTAVAYLYSQQSRVEASQSQVGQPRITLNPGGGKLSDGTDGIRFTINASPGNDGYENAIAGQDALLYRGTYQYCCSAGGPMLNIGGALYGQSGPAYSSATWSSIEIIATSGVTTLGERTTNTGNSSAILRYNVVVGGLTYSIDRTVTYVYPNDYVTDEYSFTIPEGNTQTVKFYLGGDTAPGSSDQGYGIMLTEPVRSVISLNTSSEIMFGFREVQGSRPFDGATSQSFYTPYSIVQAGNDIGFVGTASNHDAGLMMQWNLGSTPGTYAGKLQQFATKQGTNLNAAFAQTRIETGQQAELNTSVVNSELSTVSGLGYTLTLPSGLLIDAPVTSDCGGTLTATVGTGTITASGVSIAGASNCVVAVPVSSDTPGSYTVNGDSATGIQGALTNNVGASTLNIGVYAVSFVTQGGSVVSDIIAEEGDLVTLPVSIRTGYSFENWNTSPDGSGTAYNAAENFIIPSEDIMLYAVWEAIPYDLLFDAQGGNAVAAREDIFYGTNVTLPTPTRSGYQFVEWNTAPGGSGTSYNGGQAYSMPAADTTLYAIWERLYTVAYDAQGGTSVSSVQRVAGASLAVPSSSTREGYRLIGWSTGVNGSGAVYEIGDVLTVPSADTTLYAVWAQLHTLTLDSLGEQETETLVQGETYTLPSVPSRTGYTTLGWNTAANGSGEQYEGGDELTMPAGSLTLYAVWEDNDELTTEQENAAPGNGDGNGDGTPDSQQANVSSLVNTVTNTPVTLAAILNTEEPASDCQLGSVAVVGDTSLGTDSEYTYPFGLVDFSLSCGEVGFSATIKQYFYDAPAGSFVLRKFIDGQFRTIDDAVIETETINGQQVLVVTYTVIDGGILDADGEENGVVLDPAGPAYLTPPADTPSAPNTGLAQTGNGLLVLIAAIAALISLVVFFLRERFNETSRQA